MGCTGHHQFMLEQLLDHLALLGEQLSRFNDRIAEALRPGGDEQMFDRLDAIPSVNRVTIEHVVAEIGVDMNPFPSAKHLASWAGLCPGNKESTDKRKQRHTTKGNVWLRPALCEAAWDAGRSKDTYFQAQYRRLAGRRGKNELSWRWPTHCSMYSNIY